MWRNIESVYSALVLAVIFYSLDEEGWENVYEPDAFPEFVLDAHRRRGQVQCKLAIEACVRLYDKDPQNVVVHVANLACRLACPGRVFARRYTECARRVTEHLLALAGGHTVRSADWK